MSKNDNVYDKKAVECNPAKKKKDLYYVHVAIGLIITALFWIIPPIDPITPLGMKCVGSFLGMVYLWSTVEAMWPSIMGLILIGISGYGGDAGFNGVWMQAIGNYTVLLTMFAMILFGAVDEVGDTKYIAKWLLTKKIFKGRPFVFFAIFYLTCFVLSALVSPISSLIILWPVAIRLMETLKVERCDKIWSFFFVGMFLVSTLAQPFFPFMGAQLIPISALASMSASMGNPLEIPMGSYMFVDAFMTFIVMGIFLLAIKILRVDISKLKAVDPATIEATMPLPPMNGKQKAFLIMIPLYLIVMLMTGFTLNNPVAAFIKQIGVLGVTAAFILFFCIVRYEGKPMLDFKEVAYKQFNWGIFFMIAAAVYAANSLSNEATGITAFLVEKLTPILGGQPEMVFVAIMFLVALIITNFANNAAMAVVLLPVILTFSNQIGIHPVPVAMGVILMVFVAMLTPAASPHAGMMHGRKDLYSTGEILKIGFPMCIITWVLYVCIGYPLCKFLLGV